MKEYFELQLELKELEEKDLSQLDFDEKMELKDRILEIKRKLDLVQNPSESDECLFCSS